MSFLINQGDMPGTKTVLETQEVNWTWGRNTATEFSAASIDSAAVDSTNTPTTTLRSGLVMAKLATGKLTNYDPASVTPAQRVPYAILNQGVNMLDYQSGSVADKQAQIGIAGFAKPSLLTNFDANVRVTLGNRFVWDDTYNANNGGWSGPFEMTSAKTLTAADNGLHVVNFGAAGDLVLTLPIPAIGLRFKVTIAVAKKITLTPAGAGQLSITGNAAANTYDVGDSTSATIGKSVELYANTAGTKWVVVNS